VTRGEVWWFEIPELGRRPMLILTRSAAIPVLRNVLAAGITRTIRDIPTEVPLGSDDGMPHECVVILDDVRVIPKAFAVESLVLLQPERLHAVCRALAIATGCS
jgi:mRNA interferase MazF